MEKTFIDKLAWIDIQDRRILVTLSKGKDTWYIPGGKREEGESDMMALSREIKEELTVHIKPETAKLYGVFEAQAHGKPPGTIVRMTCYTAKFTGTLSPCTEIDKLAYIRSEDINTTSQVDHLIIRDLKRKKIID